MSKRHLLQPFAERLNKISKEIIDTMLLIQINDLENTILKNKLETLLKEEESLENKIEVFANL